MIVEATDLVTYAGRNGLAISRGIAREAVESVDRAALEKKHRARFTALVWNGTGDPPVGTADRWLHGEDANSRHAIDALKAPNGVVYFLMMDGALYRWQPKRADIAGVHLMVDDPSHANHWETAAKAHIESEVTMLADQDHLSAALDKALALHEERGIPYTAVATQR